MAETKHDKFVRLRDTRLPKILHALSLLENLAQSGYESSEAERQAIVEEIDVAVDRLADAFGLEQPPSGGEQPDELRSDKPEAEAPSRVSSAEGSQDTPEPPAAKSEPKTGQNENGTKNGDIVRHDFVADGGGTALSEIRWAYDAIRRGDKKLAENRLGRILSAIRDSK